MQSQEFVRAEEIPEGEVGRAFRHSRISSSLLFVALGAPVGAVIWKSGAVWEAARALPGIGWIVVAPITLIAGTVLWLCFNAARWVMIASFLRSNWLVKTARDGIYLHLRSFQNHHFPDDVPTALFLPYSAIARVRRVDETLPDSTPTDRSQARKRWLELELSGVDTAPLATWLEAERKRPAPTTRSLGVRSRTRFHHAPVVVPRPGAVYVEWMGRKLFEALAERTSAAEPAARELAAADGAPLETRLHALVVRGDPFAAVALAREERGLSLSEAKSLVDRASTSPETTARAAETAAR
jgi:hypothetical protein